MTDESVADGAEFFRRQPVQDFPAVELLPVGFIDDLLNFFNGEHQVNYQYCRLSPAYPVLL